MIRLGIDTGGTFTDAVVVELGDGAPSVLTTKGDLTRGIVSALDALPFDLVKRAQAAAISTTLATNACVENKGGRARLIIVGTTDEVLHRVDAQNKFGIPYSDVLPVKFVGSYAGDDVQIPDWEQLYADNPSFFDEADSFGIASLYALNNGAVVEKEGAAWLRERFGKVVVEAITVAAEPNVIARGATALLNARLVPVIGDFLDAIKRAFAQRGLQIPVSIVRSDGTLMSEDLARLRPVETILSGPAASVTGAQVLAGAPESLIVDIGGTTSDISIVHGGRANRTPGRDRHHCAGGRHGGALHQEQQARAGHTPRYSAVHRSSALAPGERVAFLLLCNGMQRLPFALRVAVPVARPRRSEPLFPS